MKQTTMKFSSKNPEPVTIKRLQEAIDLIAKTTKATDSLLHLGLSTNFVGYFRMTNVIQKIAWNEYIVTEPILSRKSYNRVMNLQSKYHNKRNLPYKSAAHYHRMPQENIDTQTLVHEPIKLQRTRKPRVKKAVALPWWKRFLLYLANH